MFSIALTLYLILLVLISFFFLGVQLDDWVLCKIYRKADRSRKAEERDDDDVEPIERNEDNHVEMINGVNQIGDTNVLINNTFNVSNFIGTAPTHIPNHSA